MAQEQALLQAVASFYKVLGNESRLAILHYMDGDASRTRLCE